MKLIRLAVLFLICSFCSCIVSAPRYTTVQKVFTLKIGMTKDEVTEALGVTPYYLKSMTDSDVVFLYKYRVTDRTTLPFLMGPTNGHNTLGKYVNLLITFNKKGVVENMESCGNSCDETVVQTNKVDINKVITFLSVTLPIVLVILGTFTNKL